MINQLKTLLDTQKNLELAILIGSRALHTASMNSDWDIAIRWKRNLSDQEILVLSTSLQLQIARFLDVIPEKIDLVHIPSARLAMRANIAEHGIILKGEGSLAWSHFLTQTWAEIEEHYWRASHAA